MTSSTTDFLATARRVIRREAEALEMLPPYQGGGEMIETVTKERVTYARPPHRFEAGTPPILEAIGLGAAIDDVLIAAKSTVSRRILSLDAMAFTGLHAKRYRRRQFVNSNANIHLAGLAYWPMCRHAMTS